MGDAEPPQRNHFERGLDNGFDDAWHDEWWAEMEETGGNIIAAMRMRMVSQSPENVVMSMPFGPGVRQGTGIFAAGALIQLADVAATSVCFAVMHAANPDQQIQPFPLAVQISSSLLRNVDNGMVFAEAKVVHAGRTMMVVESKVTDESGRLLCTVNTTHLVVKR
ncbi:MAG: PaaI family thioesterase [Chloroflexota bacterium]